MLYSYLQKAIIKYGLTYGRRDPERGAEGERDRVNPRLETLRQKDYRKALLWREPSRGGDRRGNPVRGRVISQVKGQRRGLI